MNTKAFTLIELLVVIAILAVLAVAVTLILNPAELIRQGRDSTRLSDLATINKALGLYQTDQAGTGSFGTSTMVYISLPDTTSTCANHTSNLPSLPPGWSYHCVQNSSSSRVDGTGWIPVDLTGMSFSSPLSRYPLDPVNSTDSGNYYAYVPGGSWHLEAPMESTRRRSEQGYTYEIDSTNDITLPGSLKARDCGENGTFTDSRDGQVYDLAKIGDQCWFADNLDYDDGCTSVTWVNNSDEGWCGYHTSDTGQTNGLLYQWSGAMNATTTEGAQGLCPSGWHIPTDAELKTMEMALGMSSADANSTDWRGTNEGGKLKVSGTGDPGWLSETCGGATCNISGWTATGGGYRISSDGSFVYWRSLGVFWSSSPSGDNAWSRYLDDYIVPSVCRNTLTKMSAFSVRCLRD